MLGKIDTPVVFGRVLRGLRLERGLSQEALAFDAGVQRNYISLLERGINQPTISVIFKLSTALGIRPGALVEQVEIECLKGGGERG